MFTYPYQILEKLLTTAVPELREIDWYLQQDSTTDKSVMLFASPGAYVEFSIVEGPRDHPFYIQSAIVDISIHLLTENALDRGSKIMQKTGTSHAVLFDKIYKTLQGFGAKLSYITAFAALANTVNDRTVINSLSRIGIINPHSIRKTMVKSVQRFRCVVYDHAATRTYTVPDPLPDLNIVPTML